MVISGTDFGANGRKNKTHEYMQPIPAGRYGTSISSGHALPNTRRRRSTVISESAPRQLPLDPIDTAGTAKNSSFSLSLLTALLIIASFVFATLWSQHVYGGSATSLSGNGNVSLIYDTIEDLRAKHNDETVALRQTLFTQLSNKIATLSRDTTNSLKEQQSQLSDEAKVLFHDTVEALHVKSSQEIAALSKQLTEKLQASQSEHKTEISKLADQINQKFHASQSEQKIEMAHLTERLSQTLQAQYRDQLDTLNQKAGDLDLEKVTDHHSRGQGCYINPAYKTEQQRLKDVTHAANGIFGKWLGSDYFNALNEFYEDFSKNHTVLAEIELKLCTFADTDPESLSTNFNSMASDVQKSLLIFEDRLHLTLELVSRANSTLSVIRTLNKRVDKIVKSRDERFTVALSPLTWQTSCLEHESRGPRRSEICRHFDDLYVFTGNFQRSSKARKDWLKKVESISTQALSILSNVLKSSEERYAERVSSLTNEEIRQLTGPFVRVMGVWNEILRSPP